MKHEFRDQHNVNTPEINTLKPVAPNESRYSNKYMTTSGHSCTAQNGQKVETPQKPVSRWMDECIVVYRILFSHKSNEGWMSRKSAMSERIWHQWLHVVLAVYTKCLEQVNPKRQEAEWWLLWREGVGSNHFLGPGSYFKVMMIFWNEINVILYNIVNVLDASELFT